MKAGVEKGKEALVEEEEKRHYVDKSVKGDASETGLVKFVEPLFRKEENGAAGWPTGGIEKYRNDHPIHKNAKSSMEDLKIDFSSDIKFNLLIRDMNPEEKAPKSIEDNICIYLKGAPDRVLLRCNRILVDGVDMELTEDVRKEIIDANDKFGNMGERVLGFSKIELDPKEFDKDHFYDVKGWKKWLDV